MISRTKTNARTSNLGLLCGHGRTLLGVDVVAYVEAKIPHSLAIKNIELIRSGSWNNVGTNLVPLALEDTLRQ